ncbi:aminodeoxychorismate lyase [Veronia nyctiphanis]|nr:aminodeoxychorismate lyase [Veronia nyctiphanis]
MIWVNGKETLDINVMDRGLQYGDGCFTTVFLNDSAPMDWPLHLERLRLSTTRLHIPFDNWSLLEYWVKNACSKVDEARLVLKIVITRGKGGRGYSPNGCNDPSVIISLSAFPDHYDCWQSKGIRLELLNTKLGLSPLAGLKHLNRLEQVMAKSELDALDAEDGVLCDINGFMIETSASNLFWRKGNRIFTPTLKYSGVEGIMKQKVVLAAEEEGLSVEEVLHKPESLLDADEIFITNTLMGLVPVNQFVTHRLKNRDALKKINKRLGTC